jgi:hypothetical protein
METLLEVPRRSLFLSFLRQIGGEPLAHRHHLLATGIYSCHTWFQLPPDAQSRTTL